MLFFPLKRVIRVPNWSLAMNDEAIAPGRRACHDYASTEPYQSGELDDRFEHLERFVDEHVIAAFLNITPRRVVEMARNAELPAHPIGHERKTWRFRLSEVDEHFRLQSKPPVRARMSAAVPGAARRL